MKFFLEISRIGVAPATGNFVLEEIFLGKPGPFFQYDNRVAGLCQGQCNGTPTGTAADYANIAIHGHKLPYVLSAGGLGKPG